MAIQSVQESDPRTFRKTLGHFASGVTVITTVQEGRVHGMTANAFCAVSFEPPLVLVCVENQRHMHRLLRQSGCYGVSILARSQEALSRHFAGRSQEGLQVPFVWYEGCPLIGGAVAHLISRLIITMISPAILFLPSLEAYFPHEGKERVRSRAISFLPGPIRIRTAEKEERTMVEHLYRIDVHQHALLPEIAFTLMKSGITTIAGIPIPPWDRASALAMMDRQGIATAIVSNPYLVLLLA